jgi:hypothetical protein
MVTESNEQCGGEFLAQGSHSLRAAFRTKQRDMDHHALSLSSDSELRRTGRTYGLGGIDWAG